MKNIKQIVNLIILFLMLFVGNMIAPDYIVTSDLKTTIVATVMCFIGTDILQWLSLVIIVPLWTSGIKRNDRLIMIIAFIFTVTANSIAFIAMLSITTHYIEGFAINGVITYAVITVLYGILLVEDPTKNSDKR